MNNKYDRPAEEKIFLLTKIAAKWSIILALARQILSIGTVMIVSRHVSPGDFGIASMVMIFVAFLVLFDTALSWATVQAAEVNQNKIDALFFIGGAVGVLMWVFAIFMGDYLAIFYKTPEVSLVCMVMGGAVFLNSLATQPLAILRRGLNQKKINIIETGSLMGSSLVAIFMATNNYGYWSIVFQTFSMYFFRSSALILTSGFVPRYPKDFLCALPELKKGIWFAFSNYICYFQLYLGGILVGHFYGSVILGNYQRAYAVKSMPTQYVAMSVTDVMVAALAALRDNPEKLAKAYHGALYKSSVIGCPAGIFLYIGASEVIHILYGDKWTEAGLYLKWFSLAAFALPISTSTIWLFLAAGRAREQFSMNAILSIIAVTILIPCAYYTDEVIYVVASEAMFFAGPCLFLNLYFSHKALNIKLRKTALALMPVIIGSFVSVLLVGYFAELFVLQSIIFSIILKAGLFSLLYFGCLIVVKNINGNNFFGKKVS